MPNPYTWRSVIRDPGMFYGRRRETAQIVSRLCGSVPLSVSIIGPRRIGKSSLLWHICRESSRVLPSDVYEKFVFLYLDCQELGKLSISKLLKHVLKELIVQSDLSGLGEDDLKDLMRKELSTLERDHKSLILVFDEFDSAGRYASAATLDYLRALAKYNVAYIIATKQPLSEICLALEASPFANIFTVLHLGPLSLQEAYDLIIKPSQAEGVTFTDEDIQFLLNAAGCHPYLVQVVGFFLFEAREENSSPLDYNTLAEQARTELEPFFQRSFYGLTELEQNALLNRLGGVPIETSIMHGLQVKGLVDTGGAIFSTLFEEFLSELLKIRDTKRSTPPLIHEVDELLKQLERSMREFLRAHFEKRYGSNWPRILRKRNPKKFESWLRKMPDYLRIDRKSELEILRYSDFADPFELIVSYEWDDLKGVFTFSKDARKSKRSLEERQELLTRVRNAIKHSREEDIADLDLEKALVFCKELMAKMSEAEGNHI